MAFLLPNINIDVSPIAKLVIYILIGLTIWILVLSILPVGDLPDDVADAISWTTQKLVDFDFIIPVGSTLQIILFIAIIETIFAFAKIIMWFRSVVFSKGS